MTNTLRQVTDAERANWQMFYADRSRRCPFFVLAPDENLVEWVQQGRLQPGRALDIGCGNARNSIYLAKHGFTVDAIDQSASAIDWAREEVSKADASVSVHCMSIFDFQAPVAAYDFVYDSGCFHHIPPHQRRKYVQLVSSALKPAATFGLVCFTPEGGSGRTDDDVYAQGSLGWGLGYDEARLRKIWGAAFDIQIFRRMRELPSNAESFGKGFLWAMLSRRNAAACRSTPALAVMELRRIDTSELAATYELLVTNGWQHRVESLDQFAALVSASQIADVAIVEGRVVGFVRGITDGLSNGYLSMVIVAPDCRGQGFGRQLVQHAIGANQNVTWVLRAGREGVSGFFAKLGFQSSSVAMERRRR